MITKYISIPVFIVTFAIGVLAVYLWGVDRKVIYVFPTPENASKIQYQDSNDMCYHYDYKRVPCPKDESKISMIPLQN